MPKAILLLGDPEFVQRTTADLSRSGDAAPDDQIIGPGGMFTGYSLATDNIYVQPGWFDPTDDKLCDWFWKAVRARARYGDREFWRGFTIGLFGNRTNEPVDETDVLPVVHALYRGRTVAGDPVQLPFVHDGDEWRVEMPNLPTYEGEIVVYAIGSPIGVDLVSSSLARDLYGMPGTILHFDEHATVTVK